MSNAMLEKFKETIDKEIIEYEAMEELYKLKQAILVQGRSDALWDVDAKIIDKIKTIKDINFERKEVAKYLGNENLTMSEAINKAKLSNDSIADKLINQKTKLNMLSNSISLHERTNMDLIKHGLTMAEKTMNIILGVLAPPPNQYDKSGKNVNIRESRIGSITEEA